MATNKNKSPEDVIGSQCLAGRLRMLNRVVTKIYDEALRPLGMKASQLNILVQTARLGLARPAEVCQRLLLDTSTLSRNVERMKANGWLEVVADADGRAQPFRLTPKGKNLLKRALPAWEKGQKRATDLLGGSAVDQIAKAATRARKSQASET